LQYGRKYSFNLAHSKTISHTLILDRQSNLKKSTYEALKIDTPLLDRIEKGRET